MKMVSGDTFTAEQLDLISFPSGVYVEACPGAGKTQSIVERFVTRPLGDPRRGVALTSFTNAAVDEVRKRCSDSPELLRPPNFVGTIDGFINRFVTGPIYSNRYKRAAVFKDSWEGVQHSTFELDDPALRFELKWFSIAIDGSASFNSRNVPWTEREPYRRLSLQVVQAVQARATTVIQQFLAGGVIDCTYSRLLMSAYLGEPDVRATLAQLLSARFSEVVVDEIQDCSRSDVELFDFLIESGIRVVMVGDPDQAIYNFRGSALDETRLLTDKVEKGRRLSGNFRSSPAICSLVDSLRAGSDTDEAVGENRNLTNPVLLMPVEVFDGHADVLRSACSEHRINVDDLVCLSHAADKARELAGDNTSPITSQARLVRIAVAADTLRDVGKGATRKYAKASANLTSRMRELHPESDLRYVADAEFFERVGLTAREFRSGLLAIAFAGDPFAVSASEYREVVLNAAKMAGWDWVDGQLLPEPRSWPQREKAATSPLRWETVHSFKGLEVEAVALAIPAPPEWAAGKDGDGVACWLKERPSEARRVLYVGASRARRLAILVPHVSQAPTVETILKRDGVPFQKLA